MEPRVAGIGFRS